MSQRTPQQHFDRKRHHIFLRVARLLTHRFAFVAGLILLQLILLVLMIGWFSRYFVQFYLICIIFSALAVLAIAAKNGHPDYKLAWCLPIVSFPVFGGLFYLFFGGSQLSRRSREQMSEMARISREAYTQIALEQDLFPPDGQAQSQSNYLRFASGCQPFGNTVAEYFSSGESAWLRMLDEIDQAEHFIFLEYFIIRPGVMWDAVLQRLEQKARQGVDVRLLYDDVGCVFTLPRRYPQFMREKGIKCGVVNPFRPVVSIRLNNRDHRKICVIDGHTGFTGGFNLADEYINAEERFGYWKDTGIMLKGQAVWNLTVMFLSTWDYTHGVKENISLYRPERWLKTSFSCPGVIQPYDDSPVDSEAVGANVYLNLISRATKSIYITTPYLVLDYPMSEALSVAAKAGIDVRIITPHIPDKKSVFEVTRANYHTLMEAGVKIYEYTPGFIHAKTFLVDGVYAVVGTINLDYRSLYLHFECGVWIYRHPVIKAIARDFLDTQGQCQQVKLDETSELSWTKRIWRGVLKLVAPLM